MESGNNSSPVSKILPALVFFSGLIALYYLYQYLFGPKTGASYTLIAKNQAANVDEKSPIIITSDKLPVIYEGGEFSISTWIYINNWGIRAGKNKAVFLLSGPTFDVVRIYIGGSKPNLHVRFHTRSDGAATSQSAIGSNDAQTEDLSTATRERVFNDTMMDVNLLDTTSMCDLPEIPMQRWVNITVAANGRTIDVYLDGKLSRSCVLPTMFRVDTGYSAKLLAYGGFGGQISTTTMYDAALNPEAVYKNYMAGPEPITTIGDWFSSVFAPGVSISVTSQ